MSSIKISEETKERLISIKNYENSLSKLFGNPLKIKDYNSVINYLIDIHLK